MALHPWLKPLAALFEAHRCPANAAAMEAYMKHIAPFFGLKAPDRRQLLRAHIAGHGRPGPEERSAVARSAFAQPEREWHHTAVDLLVKDARTLTPDDLPWIEELIATRSWWDTVDALAVHVVGEVLKRHPQEVPAWNRRWVRSTDLWLNRTALLFQNRWKDATDRELLFANIVRHADHPDFFIRKAIGWALRELAATDPGAVKAFVARQPLSALSRREALRKLG